MGGCERARVCERERERGVEGWRRMGERERKREGAGKGKGEAD